LDGSANQGREKAAARLPEAEDAAMSEKKKKGEAQ